MNDSELFNVAPTPFVRAAELSEINDKPQVNTESEIREIDQPLLAS